MHRTERKASRNSKLFTYVLTGTTAAAVSGAVLGAIGGLLPVDLRASLTVLISIGAVTIGILEVRGARIFLLQFNRETPSQWLRPGPLIWAMRNGAALGIGLGSRLGFWLWWVIPLGAMLSGSVLIGAVGYGLYGFTRTGGVRVIMFVEHKFGVSTGRLLGWSVGFRRATAAQLIVIGVSSIVIVGA